MGEVIGILSLKGGVGKTSVVTELGAALSELGNQVLLVDANFSAPNLGLHLNVFNPEVTIHHVLGRKVNPQDAIYKSDVFDIIFASMYHRIKINPLNLKDKIAVLKDKYDFIIIDSSPSLNEETLAVMLASDKLFVVTTPDHATLGTSLKAIRAARQRGTEIHGVIINKVLNKDFEVSLEDIEEVAEVPVMAVIPYSINVMRALANFIPHILYKPKSQGSEEFRKFGSSLMGEEYKPTKLRRLFGWMNPPKQDVNRLAFSRAC